MNRVAPVSVAMGSAEAAPEVLGDASPQPGDDASLRARGDASPVAGDDGVGAPVHPSPSPSRDAFPLVSLERMRSGEVPVVVSVSGGKDSLAAALHVRSLGIPFHAVFADTGWESDHTYRYLDEVVGPALGGVVVVRAEVDLPAELVPLAERVEAYLGRVSPMVRRCIKHATYPRRTMRWCTSELKLAPLRAHHHLLLATHGRVPVAVVGVRAAESRQRAELPEWEAGDPIDALVWRPLIDWSEQQVIDVIRAAGLSPNPLYLHGCRRVGCWPCIYARKEDYAVLAQDAGRGAALRELERVIGDLIEAQLHAKGLTLADKGWRRPTWHYGWPDGTGPLPPMPPIDAVLAWGRTNRRGQVELFREDELAREGCMRWGMCEVPSPEVLGDASPQPGDDASHLEPVDGSEVLGSPDASPRSRGDASPLAGDDEIGAPAHPSPSPTHDASEASGRVEASARAPADASPAADGDTSHASPPTSDDASPVERVCRHPKCGTRFVPYRSYAAYCSTRCRQLDHRFRRDIERGERAATPKRLAIADPPYPGCSAYYRGHPDFAGEVDHERLLARLRPYDGWALATSAGAEPAIARLIEAAGFTIGADVFKAIWVRGPRPTSARRPLSAYEVVFFRPARAEVSRRQAADVLVFTLRACTSDPARVIGQKPPEWSSWVFGLLQARVGDSLDDLFPGSGAVSRAWKVFSEEAT